MHNHPVPQSLAIFAKVTVALSPPSILLSSRHPCSLIQLCCLISFNNHWMTAKNSRLILFCVSLFLCACAAPVKKVTLAPPPPKELHLVGTVFQVKQTEQFVLIDVGTLYMPAPGKTLKCYFGGMKTAELLTTSERMTSFIAADIINGSPNRGDQVFE